MEQPAVLQPELQLGGAPQAVDMEPEGAAEAPAVAQGGASPAAPSSGAQEAPQEQGSLPDPEEASPASAQGQGLYFAGQNGAGIIELPDGLPGASEPGPKYK